MRFKGIEKKKIGRRPLGVKLAEGGLRDWSIDGSWGFELAVLARVREVADQG